MQAEEASANTCTFLNNLRALYRRAYIFLCSAQAIYEYAELVVSQMLAEPAFTPEIKYFVLKRIRRAKLTRRKQIVTVPSLEVKNLPDEILALFLSLDCSQGLFRVFFKRPTDYRNDFNHDRWHFLKSRQLKFLNVRAKMPSAIYTTAFPMTSRH